MLRCGERLYRLIVAASLLPALGCGAGVLPVPGEAEPADPTLVADASPSTDSSDSNLACLGSERPATTTHRAMFDALNLYRAQNSLSLLIYSKRLESAADDHVRDLWARDFFDHVNPDGEGPADRAENAGFCHRFVGENIAAGHTTVARVMEGWENSPSHNENMLEARYVYVGMGYFVDPTGRQYWGQTFAFDLP